jgi:hypothetical protein
MMLTVVYAECRNFYCCAECLSDECRFLIATVSAILFKVLHTECRVFIAMLSVVLLNVRNAECRVFIAMLSVFLLNVEGPFQDVKNGARAGIRQTFYDNLIILKGSRV